MSEHLRIEIPVETGQKKQKRKQHFLKRENKTNKSFNKSSNEHSTQSWLPFDNIVYGMLKLNDGRYIKVLEIEPQNFGHKKNKEKNKIIDNFGKWCIVSPYSFQIKAVTEKTDITAIMESLDEKTKKEKNKKLLEAKKDYVKYVKNLSGYEGNLKRYYLIIEYEGNIYDSNRKSRDEYKISVEMNQVADKIKNKFHNMGNDIIVHEDENEFLLTFLYKFICKKSSTLESLKARKQRLIRDMKLVYSLEYPDQPLTRIPIPSLKTMLSPRGIQFGHRDYIVVDGICYSFLFVDNETIPELVYANWTACFDYGEGVDVDMFFAKEDREAIGNDVGIELAHKGANYESAKGDDKDDLGDTVKAGMYIKRKLREGEDFFYGIIMITVWDYDLKRVIEKKGKVISGLAGDEIRVKPAIMTCEEAYKMYLPMNYENSHFQKKFQRNYLTSSVAATYMFNEIRLHDKNGVVIGVTGNSMAVYNNFFSKRYNNYNIGIFGPSGSGKTYFNLMLSRRLRLMDIGVMFILPIKGYEYKKGIEDLGGLFVDLAPGTNVCLNILDLHAEADVDAAILAEAEVNARNKLNQGINQITIFIQLLLKDDALSSMQVSELETVITELYNEHGITEDNLSLYDENGKLKEMPILEELYDKCLNNSQLSNVVSVLKPFINGSCKNMNGQTNIDLSNKMIGFDISNVPDRYLPAFMFIALIKCYDKIKENLYDMYALFLDEGWKFMINEMAESFVNELIKILRGYGGAAILSTQNVSDIIKGKYGESIIDNCATKFLLQVGEKEKGIYKELFNLTEEEVEKISKQLKGNITMITKGEQVPIYTVASNIEDELYQTDVNKIRAKRKMKN